MKKINDSTWINSRQVNVTQKLWLSMMSQLARHVTNYGLQVKQVRKRIMRQVKEAPLKAQNGMSSRESEKKFKN
jgi:hypothetical protein